MRISDWSSDVCSSDLRRSRAARCARSPHPALRATFSRKREKGFGPSENLEPRIPASPPPPPAPRPPPASTPPRTSARSPCRRTHWTARAAPPRSEEHTSELQSLMRIPYAVFCLKKKKKTKNQHTTNLDQPFKNIQK